METASNEAKTVRCSTLSSAVGFSECDTVTMYFCRCSMWKVNWQMMKHSIRLFLDYSRLSVVMHDTGGGYRESENGYCSADTTARRDGSLPKG